MTTCRLFILINAFALAVFLALVSRADDFPCYHDRTAYELTQEAENYLEYCADDIRKLAMTPEEKEVLRRVERARDEARVLLAVREIFPNNPERTVRDFVWFREYFGQAYAAVYSLDYWPAIIYEWMKTTQVNVSILTRTYGPEECKR